MNTTMNGKTDNYNALLDFIENIIRTTSDPHEKEDLDKTFDIARGVGKGIEMLPDDQEKKN